MMVFSVILSGSDNIIQSINFNFRLNDNKVRPGKNQTCKIPNIPNRNMLIHNLYITLT